MRRALVLALVLALLTASSAEAQSRPRPRIIWDVPPDKVIRIATLGPGQSFLVEVPFHTTGDLERAEVTVWSRGVVAGLIGAPEPGRIAAFAPRRLTIRIYAPPGVPPGPYSIAVQIADRETQARDIFRTTVLVEQTTAPTPVPPTPVPPTATPRPSPTAVPTATPTPRRPAVGWGRYRPYTGATPLPTGVAGSGVTRGAGFVRP